MSTDELPSGGPFMDERLRFYLRHRRQIEEWIPLGREVRSATAEAFAALQPEMEQLAATFGEGVSYYMESYRSYSYHTFRRPGWFDANDQPIVSFKLECWGDGLDPATSGAPYVGVILHDPINKVVSDSLRKAGDALKPKYLRRAGNWVIYRTLTASAGPNWYLDVPAWQSELVARTVEAWFDLDPLVSAAVAEAGR